MDSRKTDRVRLVPALVVVLVAFGALKAAGLAVNVSTAVAAEEKISPTPEAAQSPVSQRLAEHLAARAATLDAREAEIDTREKVLAAAEARVEAAMKALGAEKQAIALADDGRARLRQDELSALSTAYERMKPRDAARIFEILDDDILLPVAAGMRTQALAGVLAQMSSERAKALTIALANRETAPAAALAARP